MEASGVRWAPAIPWAGLSEGSAQLWNARARRRRGRAAPGSTCYVPSGEALGLSVDLARDVFDPRVFVVLLTRAVRQYSPAGPAEFLVGQERGEDPASIVWGPAATFIHSFVNNSLGRPVRLTGRSGTGNLRKCHHLGGLGTDGRMYPLPEPGFCVCCGADLSACEQHQGNKISVDSHPMHAIMRLFNFDLGHAHAV